MAGSNRRTFSEADKAAGLVTLAANDGNVKRTARDLGVSTVTVRRWRDQAQHGQGPSQALVGAATDTFVADATRVRNKAMALIEAKLDKGEGTLSDLNRVYGTATDKINVAKGLPTSRTETVTNEQSREDMARLMAATIAGAIEAARTRSEVIEATVVREIPASTSPLTKLSAVS